MVRPKHLATHVISLGRSLNPLSCLYSCALFVYIPDPTGTCDDHRPKTPRDSSRSGGQSTRSTPAIVHFPFDCWSGVVAGRSFAVHGHCQSKTLEHCSNHLRCMTTLLKTIHTRGVHSYPRARPQRFQLPFGDRTRCPIAFLKVETYILCPSFTNIREEQLRETPD